MKTILKLDSSIKKPFSFKKIGAFFFENHQTQNNDFYELYEHNYNLILDLIKYYYQQLPDKDGREHIIYSLHWWLQYQKFILSSLSHESYGVMFSLIRVALENIFLSLWLDYNIWKVEPYKDISGIQYSVDGKLFRYGHFIKSFCLGNDTEKNNFLQESFWYDFLCKFSHWDWSSSIYEHFKANNQIDESKAEKDYKKKGASYILFLQWAQLYSLKNLFSSKYDLDMKQEILFKNLNLTLGSLERQIGKEDKEVFKKILEDKWFRKCEFKITTSK